MSVLRANNSAMLCANVRERTLLRAAAPQATLTAVQNEPAMAVQHLLDQHGNLHSVVIKDDIATMEEWCVPTACTHRRQHKLLLNNSVARTH
jgi:hypothetical protein